MVDSIHEDVLRRLYYLRKRPEMKNLALAPSLAQPRTQSRINWFLAALLALTLMAVSGLANAKTAPESFADLAAELLPSVVNISTTQVIEGRRGIAESSP